MIPDLEHMHAAAVARHYWLWMWFGCNPLTAPWHEAMIKTVYGIGSGVKEWQ